MSIHTDGWKYINNFLQSHTNRHFRDFISNVCKAHPEFQSFVSKINVDLSKFGQKIIPLSIYGAYRLADITIKPWTEWFAMEAVTNLVINCICGSFPMFGSWTLLDLANPISIENDAMVEQYNDSQYASELNDLVIKLKMISKRSSSTRMSEFANHILNVYDCQYKDYGNRSNGI
jgi:hypothetical protein